MNMNILINVLGIEGSGGIIVLDKALEECAAEKSYTFFVVCNDNKNIRQLKIKYKEFIFIFIKSGILYRIFYENIFFGRLVKRYKIQLIYNFSGSAQFNILINTLQLTKVHNLLFYSRNLDAIYHSRNEYFAWLKQVFLKRIYFKLMLNQSKFIEAQSNHVKDYMSDFIDVKKKVFYIKSDVNVSTKLFCLPRKYNLAKKIKFLYIVGPHFEFIHKNFIIFVNAMSMFDQMDIDYEINITLTKVQLHNTKLWNSILDSKTNFLGYINSQQKINELYCDNTILISTSIVETLGLHVIEGIRNGVITIAPNEHYSREVYGDEMFLFDTLNAKSLFNVIKVIIKSDCSHSELILLLQDRLKRNEMIKHNNILDVFNEVINVQK
jgi:hypothetical protein